MKYLLVLALSVFASSAFANEPIDAVKQYYDAGIKNDIKAIREAITNPNDYQDGMSFMIKSYTLGSPISNGNQIVFPTKAGEIEFETILEKINDQWKVNFLKTFKSALKSASASHKVSGNLSVTPSSK